MSEIAGPDLEGLERDPDPNSLISFEVRVQQPPRPAPLPEELNDMRRVDLACHPLEPIKVDAEWRGDVHCIICGMN